MRGRVESLAVGGVRPTANICTRNRGLRGGVGRNAARPCPLILVRYSGGGTAKRLALILAGVQDHECLGWADTVDKAGFGASLDVRCYRRRTYCFRLQNIEQVLEDTVEPYFETASETYDWLNRIVAVGVGRRMPGHAAYDVFQIL